MINELLHYDGQVKLSKVRQMISAESIYNVLNNLSLPSDAFAILESLHDFCIKYGIRGLRHNS